MGERQRDRQPPMWVEVTDLPTAASHPFYRRLNDLLREHGFDDFVEAQCASFYAETMGRPGLPPGIYFRLLLIGYFEGIDSERVIRMEFGPRVLGARSIIGDPRSPQDAVTDQYENQVPRIVPSVRASVLREHVQEWFDFDGDSPYMLMVAEVLAARRLPAPYGAEPLQGSIG